MRIVDRIASKAQFAGYLARSGQYKTVLNTLGDKIWGDTISFGLHRNLSIPFPAPESNIPITVRKATQLDVDRIMDVTEPGLPIEEINIRHSRGLEYNTGVHNAYVAVTEDDVPCYFQMVVYSRQNSVIRKLWGKTFPVLNSGQVLLEGAVTPPNFRGKRIMPRAMALISDAIVIDNETEAITFVDVTNIASLKGCYRAGYVPFCYRIRHRRFFYECIKVLPVAGDIVIPEISESGPRSA